jgi:hypothetical protein
MADKQKPTEQTPKGLTVPVPKRDEFFGNLKKAAKPDEKAESSNNDRAATGADA